jgi:small subunit ribosomal protein S11
MAEEKEALQPVENAAAGNAPAEGAAAVSAVDGATAPVKSSARVRGVKQVPMGIAHIRATFNNTMVSITDPKGAVISWSSAGRAGMSGSRKSTAFASTLVGQEAAKQAVARGMHEVEIRVQGAGAGRESAIRAIQAAGLTITVIKDVTPIPHNGCRPRKRRRV